MHAFMDSRVDLFKEPRDTDHRSRPDLHHILHHLGDIFGKGEMVAAKEGDIVPGGPFENMAEWQKTEHSLLTVG